MTEQKAERAVTQALFKKYEYRDALREFTKQLNLIPRQEELLELTARKVAAAMGVTTAVVLLQDETSGNYIAAAQAGLNETKDKELILAPHKGVVAWLVMKHGETLIGEEIENTASPIELKEIKRDLEALGASLCVPLMIKDKLIGLLALGHRCSREMFAYLDIKLLEALANQLALTIGYKKIEEQMARNENLMQLGDG